eukprot:11926834-Ditylum_brightwellii.AAC.1
MKRSEPAANDAPLVRVDWWDAWQDDIENEGWKKAGKKKELIEVQGERNSSRGKCSESEEIEKPNNR